MEKKAWMSPEFCNLGIENTLGDPESWEGNDDVYVDAVINFTKNGKNYTKSTTIHLGQSM